MGIHTMTFTTADVRARATADAEAQLANALDALRARVVDAEHSKVVLACALLGVPTPDCVLCGATGATLLAGVGTQARVCVDCTYVRCPSRQQGHARRVAGDAAHRALATLAGTAPERAIVGVWRRYGWPLALASVLHGAGP